MADISSQTVEELYHRAFPIIRNKCARMLEDDAEAQDVAQETFIKLWACRSKIQDADALAAWVYQTSTRLAIDRIRHGACARLQEIIEPDPALSTNRNPELALQWRQLGQQVLRIPRRELEIGILCRLDGLTHQQAAGVSGRSERTVRRLLAKLDRRLCHLREGGLR